MESSVQVTHNTSNKRAIIGFFLSLTGLVIGIFFPIFLLLSLMGLVFSYQELKKRKTPWAIFGLILGIIAVIYFLIGIVIIYLVYSTVVPDIESKLDVSGRCLDAESMITMESACIENSGIRVVMKKSGNMADNQVSSVMFFYSGGFIGEKDFNENIFISSSEVEVEKIEELYVAPIISSGKQCNPVGNIVLENC